MATSDLDFLLVEYEQKKRDAEFNSQKRKEKTRSVHQNLYRPVNRCGMWCTDPLLYAGRVLQRYDSDQRYSLCTGKWFYPPDADAGGPSGILLPGLRRNGHR